MNLTLKKSGWGERLERLMIDLNPSVGVEALKKKIEEGVVSVFEVFCDEYSIGYFTARVDVLYDGSRDLVLLQAMSEVKGSTPIAHVTGVLLPELAKMNGCQKVRIHSSMRKLDYFLEREGFEFQESVFFKKVEA